jgi:DNA replication protein DnaC
MNQVFAPYRDKSLDDFELISDEFADVQAKIAEYIKDLDHARETGYGLTLIGPNGVGKTLLASVVLNEALSRGYRIEAIELSAYVGLYKEKFDLSSLIKAGCADDMIDSYVKVKHHIRYIRGR